MLQPATGNLSGGKVDGWGRGATKEMTYLQPVLSTYNVMPSLWLRKTPTLTGSYRRRSPASGPLEQLRPARRSARGFGCRTPPRALVHVRLS